MGFPGDSAGKESACNAGDLGLIPGLGRSPGEGNLPTPVFWPGEFQGLYSHGVAESGMTERLLLSFYVSIYLFYYIYIFYIDHIHTHTNQ